jgi:hypothetical protein
MKITTVRHFSIQQYLKKTMKHFRTILFLSMLFLLSQKQLLAQQLFDYSVSKSISEDMVNIIDSAFKYKELRNDNKKFKGIRIIDPKKYFHATKAWAYFSDKTPFAIIDKFPCDLNSLNYNDIVIISIKKQKNIICIKALCMLYKSCQQIPVYTECEYKFENKNIIKLKNTVMVMDDWDANELETRY